MNLINRKKKPSVKLSKTEISFALNDRYVVNSICKKVLKIRS